MSLLSSHARMKAIEAQANAARALKEIDSVLSDLDTNPAAFGDKRVHVQQAQSALCESRAHLIVGIEDIGKALGD